MSDPKPSSSVELNRGPSIDLQEEASEIAASDLSENLPPLYKEIWYDANGVEEEDPSQVGGEQYWLPNGKSAEGTDRDRWELLMNKLTNIENNTSIKRFSCFV